MFETGEGNWKRVDRLAELLGQVRKGTLDDPIALLHL